MQYPRTKLGRSPRKLRVGGVVLCVLFGGAARAQGVPEPEQPPVEKKDESLTPEKVAEMSLEDLMSVQVTSVAGVGTEWFTTPAAISVITGEDVRRSGFLSLADAMRMAPGVFVGHTTSSGYSVGTRGFNGSLANKTLVLIDGRAVYDPLFGGTFWDVQDVFLEDLDQIEVIRGPGATLWGANAVNGVINVLTKSSRETQGVVVNGGVGTYERAFGGARYGFRVGDETWMRVYGKWFQRDHLVDANGSSLHDDWDMGRGGFRFDHEGDYNLTVQGDAYYSDRVGEFSVRAPVPGQNIQFVTDIRDVRRTGTNLLARLGQEEEESGWSLQGYYDRTERVTNISFEVERDTFDLNWKHHFKPGARHELLWGLHARHTQDRTEDGYSLLLNPRDGENTTVGAFVQDTITLVPDKLFGMVGSKFSHNDYTGLEVQPSARLWWTPNKRHTLWASVSRPVRVPSRTEEEGMIVFGYIDTGTLVGAPPTGQIIPLGVQANDDLKSEQVLAYEAGYRTRITEELTVDAAAFFNDYNRLIYVTSLIAPWSNEGYGETYGGELKLTWRPSDRVRFEGAYSYVDVEIHGPVAPFDEASTPHNLAHVRSYLNITDNLELNSGLYYVDNVPQVRAEHYLRLDVGVTWRPTPRVELSVWGQNLLDSGHREFSSSEVERGVYIQGTVRF
jgi:iron complex outermembrane recepter protein